VEETLNRVLEIIFALKYDVERAFRNYGEARYFSLQITISAHRSA
jgi:hypothetical protein